VLVSAEPLGQPGIKVAFLSYVELDKGGAGRGAILVTDQATKPVEFRCTTLIRPTAVQRTLYGETLRPHIAVELVGRQLMHALEEKPSVVVVKDPMFLELRPNLEVHLVCVRKQGEHMAAPPRGPGGQDPKSEDVLACDSGKFQPLVLTTHWQYGSEMPSALELLRPVFASADLLEPFDRMERAVQEVDRQQSGAKS
jgi:hypothetical protein